jgi:hypothetical protein
MARASRQRFVYRGKQQLRKTARQSALAHVRRATDEQGLWHAAFVESARQSGPTFLMTDKNF